MALTHNENGSVKFENGKAGMAVVPLKADGTEGLTTALDSTTLAALENVTAVQSPTGILGLPTTTQSASSASDGSIVEAAANQRLMGYNFREDAGASASFILRNGTSTAGAPIAYITLAPGESVDVEFLRGRAAEGGVFRDMISGTVVGLVDTQVLA